ncbi:hypothetical protein D3C85_1156680 [compost metagenome]
MGQARQQARSWIAPVHAAGGQAKAAEHGLGGGEHALDPGRHTLPVEPAQGHPITALGFHGAPQMLAEARQRLGVSRFEGQRRTGEDLADGVRAELCQ